MYVRRCKTGAILKSKICRQCFTLTVHKYIHKAVRHVTLSEHIGAYLTHVRPAPIMFFKLPIMLLSNAPNLSLLCPNYAQLCPIMLH